MKILRNTLVFILIVGILIAIKFWFFPAGAGKPGSAGAKDGGGQKGQGGKTPPPVPVSVFVVNDSSLENVVYASGTILANESAELKTEASGRIVYFHLPEGKEVKAGTLLLKVNDADLHAQLDKIKSQLRLAKDSESRQRKLREIEAVSQNEYDIALSNLNSLKADSAYYRAQIAKTEVYAPFNGIIGIRGVSPGSYVTPTVVVAQIYQLDPVKLDFSLPEKYVSFFKTGDVIHFKLDGVAKGFTGKIAVIDPLVDINSRSIRFRAIVNNARRELFPGAFARVQLKVKASKTSLFVPTEAIVPVLKGKKVFVVKNGLAEDKLIETGVRTEDYIQVISGLDVGDSVVVNGNFQLKKGSTVTIAGGKKK